MDDMFDTRVPTDDASDITSDALSETDTAEQIAETPIYDELEEESLISDTPAEIDSSDDESDYAYVLKRDPSEIWASGNRAIDDTLEAMRDDLRDKGWPDGQELENMVMAEKPKLLDELSRNIDGDFTNPYLGADFPQYSGGHADKQSDAVITGDFDQSEGLQEEDYSAPAADNAYTLSESDFNDGIWEEESISDNPPTSEMQDDASLDTLTADQPPLPEEGGDNVWAEEELSETPSDVSEDLPESDMNQSTADETDNVEILDEEYFPEDSDDVPPYVTNEDEAAIPIDATPNQDTDSTVSAAPGTASDMSISEIQEDDPAASPNADLPGAVDSDDPDNHVDIDPSSAENHLQNSETDISEADDVAGWLGDVNPNFDEFDTESPYCNNCGSCAYAVYQRLEGNDPTACASADNIGYNDEMTALTGMDQVPMSPQEIEQRLLSEGEGAHAIIGIDRAEGAGHWFNAACLNGRVVAIDGQSGEIREWPPDYGDVVNWEMSVKRKEE